MYQFQNKQKLDELINKLNKDLGISINSNTYDYEILSVINDYFSDTNNALSETLNANLYENLKGEDLERFLNFFGITKLSGSYNDIYEFSFSINDVDTFMLPKKSQFIFEGFMYETTEEYIVSADVNMSITCSKLYGASSFKTSVFSEGGVVQFNVDNMEFKTEADKQKTIANFPQSVKLISYLHVPKEQESDFEYSERSKSILQQYGYSNNKKIELELFQDIRVKNVLFDNGSGLVKVIVIPKLLDEIKDVIDSAKEVVNYYKNENIEVVSPNIVGITVTGITEQLGASDVTTNILNLIYQAVGDYIVYASTKGVILKSEIINIINNILNKELPGTIVNPSGIVIGYRYYLNTNYENFIIEDTINESLTLNVADAVIVSMIK